MNIVLGCNYFSNKTKPQFDVILIVNTYIKYKQKAVINESFD